MATKDNVKNVHNLNKYSITDARLTCTLLDDDITMLASRCVFGDNGAAQSVDCPARACDRLIAIEAGRLQDACISERFADDLNNYTVQRSVVANQGAVSAVWSKTWGPHAVNLGKRVNATKIVSNIGFRVNLLRESIRPEDKGLQKLFILFFVVFKPYDKMPLKHRQAVASTAQTYVNAMWGMWSMVAPLHQICKGTEFEWRAENSTQRQCAEH